MTVNKDLKQALARIIYLEERLLKEKTKNSKLQKRSSSRRAQILRLREQLEMERHLAKLGIS